MFLFLLITESPNREQFTLNTLSLFTFLPVVLIIVVFLVLFVLTNHSLHNLHATLERSWVPSTSISGFLFLLFISSLLFILILSFKFLNISIPNFPLCNLSSQIISNWRTCSCSSFLNVRIYSLNLPVFIIEFVFHRLFNRFNIFTRPRFLLLGLSLDLFKLSLAYVLNLLLNFIFVWTCVDIVTFQTEVDHQLINSVINLIFALQIIIHHSVRLSLRVRHNQSSCNCEIKLGSWQPVCVCYFLSLNGSTWF